ncbi:quinone-dependent dihydroorotate dehydrogenase [Kutzneria sp. CA-103260]|uniref:quinone-dependent dihydroorotate dehydrogenase n=1 Tax=Kutzneria sp. CA-103260 TaxID=2802641 RepID=UPI001BA503D9|nr:quinone-dependent dihydroorotate dehydrogenase [Kutzneria sp. CA-103260]
MVYKQLVRRTLFRFGGGDPEVAHERTMGVLRRVAGMPPVLSALRARYGVVAPRTVFGVHFPNPVGLAAGMDKDGVALPAWPALGFGFVEVGTVTRHAQPGNDRPRLFRLPDSEAVINRMGFNNRGAQALADRLSRLGPLSVPLGISLGKSKVTPVERAVEDYRHSMRVLGPHGDYFAVNISSPNTPGLRSLQDRAALNELLAGVQEENEGNRPLLVKIAPDLTDSAIGELLEVCGEHEISGVIATNTTLGRDGLAPADQAKAAQAGGLSGRPLAGRALEVVRLVHKETGGRLPIIGVGGIFDPDSAQRMIDAGADLVQVYTGFIYEGPGLIRRINRSLR